MSLLTLKPAYSFKIIKLRILSHAGKVQAIFQSTYKCNYTVYYNQYKIPYKYI